MHDENIKPWDRQPGEGRRAYEAFCIFRDLGDSRSIQKVDEKSTKNRTLLFRWSARFNWQRRADAWDASITEAARQQAAAEYTAMLTRQKNIGHMLQNNAAKALQDKKFDKASYHALAELIRLGVEMERSAYELAQGKDAGKTETITFTFSRGEGAND